jgi:hypothetical protein
MRPDGALLVLVTFAGTTMVALFETHQAKARLPGGNPATQKIRVIRASGKKGAIHSPTTTSQRENLKIHFRST